MDWKKKYLNKVVQGDCMDVMKELPDNCIDLVLTDPPYGIGAAKEKNTPRNGSWRNKSPVGYKERDWDNGIPSPKYFKNLFRVSSKQIIWGGNFFGLKGGYIFWDKMETMPNYTKGELAWVSGSKRIDKFEFLWSGYKKAIKEKRDHPTQKPLELMVWCLENYLLKNWKEDRRPIVFDGFAGSGTTAVACKKCGCDYILVEKEKDYVDICNKRLAQETLF